jgi:hypothetical protein
MERRSNAAIRCVKEAGFTAIAEYGEVSRAGEEDLPPYLRYSTPLRRVGEVGFPALRRRGLRAVTRDLMLGLAALGLPITVTAHPSDVGIGKLPWLKAANFEVFDLVLNFARDKNLQSRSLIDLFEEMKKWPHPWAVNSNRSHSIMQ